MIVAMVVIRVVVMVIVAMVVIRVVMLMMVVMLVVYIAIDSSDNRLLQSAHVAAHTYPLIALVVNRTCGHHNDS